MKRSTGIAGCGLVAALLGGCGGGGEAPAVPQAPTPSVNVVVADPQPLPSVEEVPGRVQAYRTAEVRARVDGIVERRLYEEGTNVEAGQELFLIDPREMRADVNAAAAALESAEAEVENAWQDVERYQGLVEDEAISQQEYDAAVARLRTAEAGVAQARAELQSAELNLDFATVDAPIAGRVSRAQVTEGALVSATSATLLTRIEQLDPVYVNFSASSGELLEIRRAIAEGALDVPELGRVSVTLLLEDGSVYSHEGYVDFLDLSIDQETGTAALRAEVPNPNWVLLPGQFVRVRIEVGVRPEVTLIPQRAVQFSERGTSVLVVGAEGTVMPREVSLGEMREGKWVVLDGLAAGDRVVVEGFQTIQPGQPVEVDRTLDLAEVGGAAPDGEGEAPAEGSQGGAGEAPAEGSQGGAGQAPADGSQDGEGDASADDPTDSADSTR